MTADFYSRDLAYIHDRGYLGFADRAAPGVLRALAKRCSPGDLIVEIGCGSGGLTRHLADAGYRILALDYSAAMIALARKKIPRAKFHRGSFYDFTPPRCSGIVAAGECFNYVQAGSAQHPVEVRAFFRRAGRSLRAGGVLLFDFLEPVSSRPRRRGVHNSGEDWIVIVEGEVRRRILRREITTIRQIGPRFRVSKEGHRQYLFTRAEISRALDESGFAHAFRKGYGRMHLNSGHVAVEAIRREETK